MRGLKTKEQSKWKKIAFFCVLFLVLIFLLKSVRNVYQKKKAADEALIQMQKEITELEARKNSLDKSLSRMETEDGVEFEIRKKLNVAEAGEKVAIIVESTDVNNSTQTDISFWQKFKNFFVELFQ